MNIESADELIDYLRRTSRIGCAEVLQVSVLRGGVSNRTVLVSRESGEEWVLKQALDRLRVREEWLSDPARIHREAEGLRWLPRLTPPGSVTPLIFEDREFHLLAMEAVPQPHENWKLVLLEGRIDLDHVRQFAQLLGHIHLCSSHQHGVLRPLFCDRSFFDSLRLDPYYRFTAEREPAAAAFLSDLIRDTQQISVALVHGDYSPKNILIHQNRLILVDHEVIHFGDPAFDIGFSLTHLLSKSHHCSQHRRRFHQAARTYWTTYLDTIQEVSWVADLEERAVRHTLGCLLARVAGKSQLEYLSQNERRLQRSLTLEFIAQQPARIPELIDQFVSRLEDYA